MVVWVVLASHPSRPSEICGFSWLCSITPTALNWTRQHSECVCVCVEYVELKICACERICDGWLPCVRPNVHACLILYVHISVRACMRVRTYASESKTGCQSEQEADCFHTQYLFPPELAWSAYTPI